MMMSSAQYMSKLRNSSHLEWQSARACSTSFNASFHCGYACVWFKTITEALEMLWSCQRQGDLPIKNYAIQQSFCVLKFSSCVNVSEHVELESWKTQVRGVVGCWFQMINKYDLERSRLGLMTSTLLESSKESKEALQIWINIITKKLWLDLL